MSQNGEQLQLVITARAPIAVGERKPTGRAAEAHSFIPGGLIRGAVAEAILHLAGGKAYIEPGDDFSLLFLNEDSAAIFRHALPARAEKAGTGSIIHHRIPLMLPATARSCKDNSGFRGDDKAGEKGRHGVFDTLIDRLCAEQLDCFIPYAPTCPECGSRVEGQSGIYATDAGGAYHTESVAQRLLERVAINRHRCTAEDELLYSLSVLSEVVPAERNLMTEGNGSPPVRYGSLAPSPSRFVASVELPHRSAHLAGDLRRLLGSGLVTRLGGGTSRGLGRVQIEVIDTVPSRTVEHRVERFNQELSTRWALFQQLPCGGSKRNEPEFRAPGEWIYFTVGLHSDAILRDGWQSTMVLDERMLAEACGTEWVDAQTSPAEWPQGALPLKLVRSYASYTYRAGWNAPWGFPKDVAVTTLAGSVFVFRTPATYARDWVQKLAGVELQGVGLRLAEGFGRVCICDEFHLIRRENPV